MSIYTGTGDSGETSLLSGRRVSKNDILIHFEGSADELNSHLGLIKAIISDERDKKFLNEIQGNLMKLMAHASDITNGQLFLTESDIAVLEKEIDRLSEKISLQMVIPGKSILEAQIHITRTVARRAERVFTALNERQPLCPKAGVFLNRLSDYLFVLSQQE